MVREAMAEATTDSGASLLAFGESAPTLVLFVRHQGCTFCREALSDLAAWRATPAGSAMPAAVVHMGTDAQGRALLDGHGLEGVAAVSDPQRELYRAFELPRGTLRQLFGPRVWWRGFLATLRGHFVGRLVGDGFQMPGAFVVQDGRILKSFRHRDAADRPDLSDVCRVSATLGAGEPSRAPDASGSRPHATTARDTRATAEPMLAGREHD